MSTWLLVGLGNPGPTYASHRHNVGYRVVDELARRAGSGFSRSGQLRAELVATRLTASGGMGGLGAGAEQIILLKPRTFMNESGQSVVKALAYYKIPAERLVVVHDELDLDFGRIRLKFGGSDLSLIHISTPPGTDGSCATGTRWPGSSNTPTPRTRSWT